MPGRLTVTLYEGDTQTVVATITPETAGDDLTGATAVTATIKDTPCAADTAASAVTLSSADPAQIVITAHTAATIVAEIVIPATVTSPPYERWWRLDVWFGPTIKRTAAYGPVAVVDV